ncbi:MAG: hypothetical protein ABEJ56_06360 [Candidatus Nanohaloarchaea archaeon]
MGLYASEVSELVGEKKEKLGDRLSGKFSEIGIDSVEEVRKLRERK